MDFFTILVKSEKNSKETVNPGKDALRVEFEDSDRNSSQNRLTIAQAIYLSGLFPPPSLCSGLGRCGKCRVRFTETTARCMNIPTPVAKEEEVLGLEAVAAGWRLGCLHMAQLGLELELPDFITVDAQVKENTIGCDHIRLAIDFGSTSVCSVPVCIDSSGLVKDVQNPQSGDNTIVNPQMGAGSDIMSRLAFAGSENGAGRLSRLSIKAIREMVDDSSGKGACIDEICLAANPAMTMLVLGKDSSGLRAAPYFLGYKGGIYEEISGLPPVWVAPLISPFIGGDISAGYAWLASGGYEGRGASVIPAEYPFLLADLGTNGEFILALSPSEAIAASIPLGPALEGIGLSFGTEARLGAITSFNMTPFGVTPVFFDNIEVTEPVGITGSGYLSLLHSLRKSKLLKSDGQFASVPELAAGLGKMLARYIKDGMRGRKRFMLPYGMYLEAADVEELLKVKASFNVAIKMLLGTSGLKFGELKTIFIAGAMGLHIPISALEGLGFLPDGSGGKVKAVGNSALSGAKLLLEKPEMRPHLVSWCNNVRTISLTDSPDFMRDFAACMNFSKTHEN